MATNWFPHDSSAGMDQRILVLRSEMGNRGYGMYWLALEAMYETSDGKLDESELKSLRLRMNERSDVIVKFFDLCVRVGLFTKEDGMVYSQRLVEEKAILLSRSESQRKRAERRWDKEKGRVSTATALPRQSHGNAPTVPTTHNPVGSAEKNERTTTKPIDRKEFTSEDISRIEVELKSVGQEFAGWDDGYWEKTWDQRSQLQQEDRITFYQKAERAIFYSRQSGERPKQIAKRICLELAGLVNDKGAMQSRLTTSEAEARRLFKEETGQEIDEA